MPLDLNGINFSLLVTNPDEPQQKSDSDLDLSDINLDELKIPLSTPSKIRKVKGAETFQPEVDFDINTTLPQVKEWFRSSFNKDLPHKLGQTALHTKLGFDHNNSADIQVNPDSDEGIALLNYLRSNNIPFRASRGRETNSKGKLISTGVHIHLGRLSRGIGVVDKEISNLNLDDIDLSNLDLSNVNLDSLSTDTQTEAKTDLDLGDIDLDDTSLHINPNLKTEIPLDYEDSNLVTNTKFKNIEGPSAFELTGIPLIGGYKAISGLVDVMRNNPEELAKITELIKAGKAGVIKNKNPDRLLKPKTIQVPSFNKEVPDNDTIIETLLFNIDPELVAANQDYKEKHGKSLITLPPIGAGYDYKDGIYNYDIQMTGSAARLINAYARGGDSELKKEREKISTEREAYVNELGEIDKGVKDKIGNRPWLTNVLPILNPASGLLANQFSTPDEREQFIRNIEDRFVLGNLQLLHNAEMLGRAANVSLTKGFDSKEYLDLINEDRKRQAFLNEANELLPKPKTLSEHVFAGFGAALSDTPKMLLAGRGLPLLVYLEHLHNGNREAATAAFSVLPLLAAGHLSSELTAESVRLANYSLASKVIRQLEVRGIQGGTQALSDFAFNPSEYLNGSKSLAELNENFRSGKLTVKDILAKTIERAIPAFATGAAFPVGKVNKSIESFIKPDRDFYRDDVLVGPLNKDYQGFGPEITDTSNPFKSTLPIQVRSGSNITPKYNLDAETLSTRHNVNVGIVDRLLTYDPDNLLVYRQALAKNIESFEKRTNFSGTKPETINRFKNESDLNLQNTKTLALVDDILTQYKNTTGQGVAKLPVDLLSLNLIRMKEALNNKTYLKEGLSTSERVNRENNLKMSIKILEDALPPEVVKPIQENRLAIEMALTGRDLNNEKKAEFKKYSKQNQVESISDINTETVKTNDKISTNNNDDNINPRLSSLDILRQSQISSKKPFDSTRKDVIKVLDSTATKDGIVLNTGLNPESFVDQFKLLYKGFNNFKEFSKAAKTQFGEWIEPHLKSLWDYTRTKLRDFNDDERGSWGLFSTKSPSVNQFYSDRDFRKMPKDILRKSLNTIVLAQINPNTFGKAYDVIRDVEGLTNSQANYVINQLRQAVKIDDKLKPDIAEVIYIGNEQSKTYTDAELLAGDPSVNRPPLNAEQVLVYKNIREAQDKILEIRKAHELHYAYRDLSRTIINSPEYNKIQTRIKRINDHYNDLKNEGYVTLKRSGNTVIEAEDLNYPIGDIRRRHYTHARNRREARKIEEEFRGKGLANIKVSELKNDTTNIRHLSVGMTPSAFEELVIRSGANTNNPEIQQIREEVYSRYGSHAYKLKRDFVPGYQRTFENLTHSMETQMGIYERSYFTNIGREEGMDALNQTNLFKDDYGLYQLAKSYIEDATSPYEVTTFGKFFTKARQATSFMQLAYDNAQFWMNAYAQPISQTYSYFSRLPEMKGIDSETYFGRAQKLTHQTLIEHYAQKKSIYNKDQAYTDFVNRGFNENLLTARMTGELIKDYEGGLVNKLISNGFIFNRAGEVVTRLHAFSEAYLVGKEKLNLSGEDLYKFMRRAVDATQGVGGTGENPFYIRKAGEAGKLFYQFGKFNMMWFENLGLSIKADLENIKIPSKATGRHLAGLGIMGGIAGLPLTAFSRAIYTTVTGKDPKDEFKKYMKDYDLLYSLANYGLPSIPAYILGSSAEGISRKVAITTPFLDSVDEWFYGDDSIPDRVAKTIPVVGTVSQASNVFGDTSKAIQTKRLSDALVAGEDVLPKAAKNIVRGARFSNDAYNNKALRNRANNVIVPSDRLSNADIFGQFLGITPAQISDYYDTKKYKAIKESSFSKKVRKYEKRIGLNF